MVDQLSKDAKSGDEKAIKALGRLAVALPDELAVPDSVGPDAMEGVVQDVQTTDLVGLILDKLLALHELKSPEVHLAVGEALSIAVTRRDSVLIQIFVDVEVQKFDPGRRPGKIAEVLNVLLLRCKSTKPSFLRASGIWLLCIVEHCYHLEEVQSRLRECQAAFMGLLSSRDEFVQGTASKGLVLVYERV